MKSTQKHNQNVKILKMLGYAAAALSIVSFMTTMNGLVGIVTDNLFFAGLISFAIQAIILVVGLSFLTVLKTIVRRVGVNWKTFMILSLMSVLYACSIGFSSFFSFVYIANEAYDDVKLTDYNMEIELFLNENIREVKNINNSINNILLRKIREVAPNFKEVMEKYEAQRKDEQQDIIDRMTLYRMSTLSEDAKFVAKEAINAYEGVNQRTADERLVESCKSLEQDINQYITYYNENYYPTYYRYFKEITTQINISQVELRKDNIQRTIDSIESRIEALRSIGHIYGSIENYVKARCETIISGYDFLIIELNKLINVYDEIAVYLTKAKGEDLTLQNFYEVIYSSDTLTQEDIESVSEELQEIISICIESSDEIDEGKLEYLIICIEYLGELRQCRELQKRIVQFENTNLMKTYIISKDDAENSLDMEYGNDDMGHLSEVEIDDDNQRIYHLQASVWNNVRHEDISIFISLVKALPDINVIIHGSNNVNTSYNEDVAYLRTKNDEYYISNIIEKSYLYGRTKLENISDIERAWDYLLSKNNFLAIFSFSISCFLDVASFLIGIYMYACREKAQSRNEEKNSNDSETNNESN